MCLKLSVYSSLIPSLSTVQFLITYCMQKNSLGKPVSFYHVNDVIVYLGRQRGQGPPYNKNELEVCFVVSV